MQLPRGDRAHPKAEEFRSLIRDAGFPCVGAEFALSKRQMRIMVARDITSAWDNIRIQPALPAFAARHRRQPNLFQSFAVVFEGPGILDVEGLERHLWERVQSLSDKDA